MPWKDPEKLAQAALLAALASSAGALDYLYGIYRKRQVWSVLYFLLHLCLAAFSGWLGGMTMSALGYGWEAQLAAAGLAGFMNVRALELVESLVERRVSK